MKYNFTEAPNKDAPVVVQPESDVEWTLVGYMPYDMYLEEVIEEEFRPMRQFATGATRDSDDNKLDYEGFISPLVTKRFAQYMHEHRKQADGQLRASDNWMRGIPKEAYVKSLVRHVEDVKLHHDGYADEAVDPSFESVLCAVMFNVQGLLYELLKERRLKASPASSSAESEAQPSPEAQQVQTCSPDK